MSHYFLPTPTATRTVDSLVLEGEAYFEAGKIYDPEGKDAIDAYYDVLERHPENAQVRAELAQIVDLLLRPLIHYRRTD